MRVTLAQQKVFSLTLGETTTHNLKLVDSWRNFMVLEDPQGHQVVLSSSRMDDNGLVLSSLFGKAVGGVDSLEYYVVSCSPEFLCVLNPRLIGRDYKPPNHTLYFVRYEGGNWHTKSTTDVWKTEATWTDIVGWGWVPVYARDHNHAIDVYRVVTGAK